jgi:single-strand DNA-binding protein
MNFSIFTGNLGRDPELRQHNGDHILNFPIGVQTGNKEKPETMWVDCALWGKRATSLQPYLAKGNRVTVSGTIKLEEYKAKDGTPKARLRLSVDQIDLPPKSEAQAQTQQTQQAKQTQQPAGDMADMDDDIPF